MRTLLHFIAGITFLFIVVLIGTAIVGAMFRPPGDVLICDGGEPPPLERNVALAAAIVVGQVRFVSGFEREIAVVRVERYLKGGEGNPVVVVNTLGSAFCGRPLNGFMGKRLLLFVQEFEEFPGALVPNLYATRVLPGDSRTETYVLSVESITGPGSPVTSDACSSPH